MSFFQAVREGVRTVHCNWQLILVQLAFMVLSFISFFMIVGVPIAIAFIIFGLDLTEMLRVKDVMTVFRDSAELLGKYFGIAFLIIMSAVFYVGFILISWVFTLAATMGLFAKTIRDGSSRFTLSAFFSEGRRYFGAAFVFSVLITLLFVVLAAVLGAIGSGVAVVIDFAKEREATLALFMGVFFSLLLLSVGLFLIVTALSFTVYGLASLSLNRRSSWTTMKETAQYLFAKPESIGFYGLLLGAYIVAGFVIVMVSAPFSLIPVVGALLVLPFQLATYVAQGYLGLIMLASAFVYYHGTGYEPPPSAEPIEETSDGAVETEASGGTDDPQTPGSDRKEDKVQA